MFFRLLVLTMFVSSLGSKCIPTELTSPTVPKKIGLAAVTFKVEPAPGPAVLFGWAGRGSLINAGHLCCPKKMDHISGLLHSMYRVNHSLADLGWVDRDLDVPSILPN